MQTSELLMTSSKLISRDKSGMRHGDIKILKPDKNGNLKYIKTVPVNTEIDFDVDVDVDGKLIKFENKLARCKHSRVPYKIKNYNCLDCKKACVGRQMSMVRCTKCQDKHSRELKKVWNENNRKAPLKGPKAHRGL